MSGLGACTVAPKSRSGGRKSGSLVRFIGEGIEGTGERDALDEVGESGGSSMVDELVQDNKETTTHQNNFPA